MGVRASKLMTVDDAVGLVEPGMKLSLGGAVHAGRPAAFVRALVRRGPGKVVLYPSPGSAWDTDLLVGTGLVERAVLPMVTFGEFGLAPSFRGAVESGEITAANTDTMSMVAGLLAGAYGHPYHLIRSLEGTDIVDDPDLYELLSDSKGRRHRAVRAIVPDLCVLHVEEADEFGNVRHAGSRVLDVIAARASRHVIVQAERIVTNELVRSEPSRTTIPGFHVHGVIEARFGAHPTATSEYMFDSDHLRTYVRAAEARRRGDASAYTAYLDRYVYGPRDERAYYDTIGGTETERRLREELDGTHR